MADMIWNGNECPISTPEEQGIYSKALLEFFEGIKKEDLELHSLHVIRNNHMIVNCVAKPFTQDSPHRIYSAAKGIQALAIMFLVQEGKIDLYDKVVDIFSSEEPDMDKMDPRMKDMTVIDLLTMSNGHPRTGFYEMRQTDNWIKAFLEQPLLRQPGTKFEYNNAPPHLVCCIPRAITGQDMIEYLTPRFFEPLGIYDLCEKALDPKHPEDLEPTTQCLSPISFIKFAQFFLQHGSWNGKQLLKAELADMIGRRYFPTYHIYDETRHKYGFGLFCYGNHFGGYHFSGGYGQQAFVIPELNMTIEFMANEEKYNVDKFFELIDKHIIRECFEQPVPFVEEDYKKLQNIIANYNLAPDGTAKTENAERINSKKLVLNPNEHGIESVVFAAEEETLKLEIIRNGKIICADCGLNGEWKENEDYPFVDAASSLSKVIKGYEPAKILGYEGKQPWLLSAAWIAEDKLQINARRMDLMCMVKQTFTFTEKTASVRIHYHFLPGNNEKNPDITLAGVLV